MLPIIICSYYIWFIIWRLNLYLIFPSCFLLAFSSAKTCQLNSATVLTTLKTSPRLSCTHTWAMIVSTRVLENVKSAFKPIWLPTRNSLMSQSPSPTPDFHSEASKLTDSWELSSHLPPPKALPTTSVIAAFVLTPKHFAPLKETKSIPSTTLPTEYVLNTKLIT